MSPRATRSSARLAAASAAAKAEPSSNEPSETIIRSNPRKRKASTLIQPSSPTEENSVKLTPPRRAKRQRQSTGSKTESDPSKLHLQAAMAKPGSSSTSPNEDNSRSRQLPEASKRKLSRGKKPTSGKLSSSWQPVAIFDSRTVEQSKAEATTGNRRHKLQSSSKDRGASQDASVQEQSTITKPSSSESSVSNPAKIERESSPRSLGDDIDNEDPFASGFLGRGPSGFTSAVRALGLGSGTGARLRGMLDKLKQTDDPSIQLMTLQDLAQTLLMAQEDSLQGQIPCDAFVKELVTLMQNNAFGVEIPMVACRCIANLMEVLPPSVANVVYGNAVPVLCQKLFEVEFLDVAEQALSTLEKISTEFPSSIVREGGLNGCLQYLDFFPIAVQRTAVTTAANCCRNIPLDSFATVRDVMPNLLNVLNSNDHGVMEQASLCVSRLVESFKYEHEKLESIVSTDLLKAIRRLLLPSAVNMIGPNIHTQFLRVLSITARASPKLSAELIKMGIVDTLYQILTGVSPPTDLEDVASSIDSVLIMQALIHRPRDQVYETLNVVCELLPGIQPKTSSTLDRLSGAALDIADDMFMSSRSYEDITSTKRLELLQKNKHDLMRFAVIMFPTLTDAYSSTVNLSVRQKVLTAQLKMLSNLDVEILQPALQPIPYASFLASILSQQDHSSLVIPALEAAEYLMIRMEEIYSYQFHREGVIAEIKTLAERSYKNEALASKMREAVQGSRNIDDIIKEETPELGTKRNSLELASFHADRLDAMDDDGDDDEEDGDGDENDDDDGDGYAGIDDTGEIEHLSRSSSDSSDSERQFFAQNAIPDLQDLITIRAQYFLDTYQGTKTKEMGDRAALILEELQGLAKDIENCQPNRSCSSVLKLFTRLCKYFSTDEMENVTSAELLRAGLAASLVDSLNSDNEKARANARTAFLQAFMSPLSQLKSRKSSTSNLATPFSVLVHKLQDVLSRSEHFEVLTIHQNAMDSNRSSASSMLSKQLRLRLVPEEQSDTSRHRSRDVTISIHAIATFKALDDYLRPRLSLSDRSLADRSPKALKNRGEEYLTNLAGVLGNASPSNHLVPSDGPESKVGDSAIPPPPVVPTPSTRSTRQSSKAKGSSSSENKEKPITSRRSSRRKEVKASDSKSPPEDSEQPIEQNQTQLECVDEKTFSEVDDDVMDEVSALEAIVDDLEEGLETEQPPDPTAVNMEVASTGKVTARKEDGSRVPTPSHSSSTPSHGLPHHHFRQLLAAGMGSAMSSRYMSYAAAMQSIPQDWHLEFSIDGKPIPSSTTIYRAVQENCNLSSDPLRRNLWSACHAVKFKRVSGPPPPENSALNISAQTGHDEDLGEMPTSLQENPVTASILKLLKILHELNLNLDDVLEDGNENHIRLSPEPLASFVNTKLTAKLNRQLEEPLIVASSCLPRWSQDLPKIYPFLFPFETRHLFLQSTSFGYSRSMTRWHNAQAVEDTRRDRHRDDRPFMGRLQRQKVRISRNRILDSAEKVLELYGSSPSMLEVEYFEEVGTGLGPTLEFYSTVSKEFSKKAIKIWRDDNQNDLDEYAFGKLGLFPAPMNHKQADSVAGKKILQHFKMLGKFIARSMLDSRIIDVSLNPTFFRIGNTPSTVPLSLGAVKSVDPQQARSLKMLKQFSQEKKRIVEDSRCSAVRKSTALKEIKVNGALLEDLSLDFTLPGYPSIELVEGGAGVEVSIDNVENYIDKVIDLTIGSGVQRQVDAFRAGFSQAFPYSALRAFTPKELVMLFGRVEEDWSLETLLDSIKADHGFNMDSRCVRDLLQVMSELTLAQRRDFLQFVTGSPKLPIGGFKALTPIFTVVRKPAEPPYTSNDFLISVMTCANYVKLPEYSSIDVLRERLLTAIEEGQGAFHLS